MKFLYPSLHISDIAFLFNSKPYKYFATAYLSNTATSNKKQMKAVVYFVVDFHAVKYIGRHIENNMHEVLIPAAFEKALLNRKQKLDWLLILTKAAGRQIKYSESRKQIMML